MAVEHSTCDMDEVKHMALEKFKELVADGTFEYKRSKELVFFGSHTYTYKTLDNSWDTGSFILATTGEKRRATITLFFVGQQLPLDRDTLRVARKALRVIASRDKQRLEENKRAKEQRQCASMLAALAPKAPVSECKVVEMEEIAHPWWRFWK